MTNNLTEYKIILLDDDPKYVSKKVEVLKSYGYNVEGETAVDNTLAKLRSGAYDLLILDYLMDDMRGDKVVEAIRKFDKDLYILLLTGYAEAPALEIMSSLDITAYCEKSNENTQLLILIKSALKSVDMMRRVKKTRDGFNRILQSVPKIFQLQSINLVLQDILSQLVGIIGTADAFILVDNFVDYQNQHIDGDLFCGSGAFRSGIASVSESLLERVKLIRTEKRIMRIEDGILIPINDKGCDTLGMFFIGMNPDKVPDEDLIQQITVFTAIAASAITNCFLQNTIRIINAELKQTKEEKDTWYLSTVETIRLAIDAKDHYTCGHSDNVSEYAVKIGQALGLPQSLVDILKHSGTFHDVGKIGIEDVILKKAGPLTDEEYEEIKKHPQRGALILSAVSMFKDIVPVVMYHHERYDGRGYPTGLQGNEIPLLARILSVADALDAMTTDRIYSRRRNFTDTVEELRSGYGTQFDPEIVDVVIDLIINKVIDIDD
jgi:HD-GYP domain